MRIIAPKTVRVQRLASRPRLSDHEALHEIEKSDKAQANFIRSAYQRDWADSSGYDLVIDTGRMTISRAASMIENVWYRIYEEEHDESIFQVDSLSTRPYRALFFQQTYSREVDEAFSFCNDRRRYLQ